VAGPSAAASVSLLALSVVLATVEMALIIARLQ